MNSRDPRSLSRVGLVFVALSAATAVNVIWRVGSGVRDTLVSFGTTVPAPTYIAIHSRGELSLAVLVALVVAIGLHWRRRSVFFMVVLGCLELAIAGGYIFAMWWTMREIP